MDGRGNHPSIIQYQTFNEVDMYAHFNVPAVVRWAQKYDSTRLIDADSGGPANADKVGDVNDLHAGAPNPMHPEPSKTQYAMDGEFGNLEYFIPGHTWTNSSNRDVVCRLYRKKGSPPGGSRDGAHGMSTAYISMLKDLQTYKKVSVASYVQLTDTEMECDGLLSYDRTAKFNASDFRAVVDANIALVGKPVPCSVVSRKVPPSGSFPMWF